MVVLELSSFQIEQLAELGEAPQIALLTNLTPNHLDRYGTFEAYCAAKEGLFRHQRLNGETPAISLFNAEDEVSAGWFDHYRGQSGRVCMKFSADDVPAKFRDVYRLPGRAYLSNLAGAVAIARSTLNLAIGALGWIGIGLVAVIAAGDFRESPDWCAATCLEGGEQAAFGGHGDPSVDVVESVEEVNRRGVIGATFTGQSTLPGGGEHLKGINELGGFVGAAEPQQTSASKEHTVVLAGRNLGETGVDVAADRYDLDAEAKRVELRLTSR